MALFRIGRRPAVGIMSRARIWKSIVLSGVASRVVERCGASMNMAAAIGREIARLVLSAW